MKRFLFALLVILSPFTFHLSLLQAYTNPILPYDFPNQDVIRLGNYYYMIYSSYASTPGLQVLRSEDAIHWEYADAVLPDTVPGYGHLDACPAGNGVWAPSIRFHDGRFYIYYGDPEIGIYCIRSVSKTVKIPCKWEPAVLVKKGKGLVDPCPLWDGNGRCYLVHAYAGKQAGFKSALAVCELSSDGLSVIHDDEIVFDGHATNPNCEGPKLYKRNAYYYIFCSASDEMSSWHLCLRSKSPYGPYEVRRVLEQGQTEVSGLHYGAWIDNWFFHLQDVGVGGRIVHMQPLKWRLGWPVIGEEGQPVAQDKYDGNPKGKGILLEAEHEEFESLRLGPEWQWSGNRRAMYAYCHTDSSFLRLFTYPADEVQTAPNLLLHKIPGNMPFLFEARIRFHANFENVVHEQAGLIIYGRQSKTLPIPEDGQWWYARIVMTKSQVCRFYLSNDGRKWALVDDGFQAVMGDGVGARVGFFATRDRKHIDDAGYLDIDWMNLTPAP